MNLQKEIMFYVNNQICTVDSSTVTPETSLNKFLRNNLRLTGTKRMCMEGGCGACIVTVKRINPVTKKSEVFAVNSCLVSIFTCHSWSIYTIEGIGDSERTHPIQNALIAFNGTQCGYCTPGMIMNMHALSEMRDLTMRDVENSLGGNICRCTGYRSILSAFKSICIDASAELIGTYPDDIEDLKLCKNQCGMKLICTSNKSASVYYKLNNVSWIKVCTIYEIIQVMKTFQNGNYMFVAGNTAKGVYKLEKSPDVYVDISNVTELLNYEINEKELKLGGNMSLSATLNLFQSIAKESKHYSYVKKLADHIDLIANVPLRNIGSLAGNLMIKHKHKEFPSDLFVIFEAVNAKLNLVDLHNNEITVTLLNFLQLDMSGKLIKSIVLSPLDEAVCKVESYKIMPRAQNAHALVNAAFLVKFEKNVIKQANLVYGCINRNFTHASRTELFLINKNLFDNQIMQKAFEILDKELVMDHVLPDSQPEFRKKLAISLFYKFILSIAPIGVVNKRNISGGWKLTRPISRGTQDYETNASLYPVSKPISKIEAISQCTGDACFISDMPDYPNQLYAAFVLAKAPPNSHILKIRTEKALDLEGVVAFYDKNDIPGRNTFTPKEANLPLDEELFCSGKVKYYNQPVGIIVAKSQELAEKAADLVRIQYKIGDKPLVKPREIIKANVNEKISQDDVIVAKSRGTNVTYTLNGTLDLNWQYHFHMETHVCSVVPTEDGFDMFPSSQWIDLSQVSAAVVLGLPANAINVQVRRIGGAFGGKIIRNAQVSCATALAAFKLRQPVKMWLSLETNMNVIGKRFPLASDYSVQVDKEGRIQYLNQDIYYDHGACSGTESNEKVLFLLWETYLECYKTDTWNANAKIVNSDMHPGAYIRAPGSVEGFALVESLMEHIAIELNLDPLTVRLNNFNSDKNPKLLQLINEFQMWADLANRKETIKQFNNENCWRKKGLAVVPMAFPISIMFVYGVLVSIYQADGTVSISHGGVEIGQGVNTKAAQVCAYKFGIPMEKIAVKPSNNLTVPNSLPTGGSVTSEGVCWAVIKACDVLLERMEPVRKTMNNPSWEELVKKCAAEYVNLSVTYLPHPKDPELGSYKVYGIAAAEVELDVLTGLHQIVRVDVLEDTGEVLSPQIDIGQVEGAFVMGLGYFLTEEIVTTSDGEILTNRSWNYKPPGVKDIPIDFRVKFPRELNSVGVLKSKAVGEPPLCLALSVPLAIRQAVACVRGEFDKSGTKWYPINGPSTVEDTFTNCLHNYKNYVL